MSKTKTICKSYRKLNDAELIRIKLMVQKSSGKKEVYFRDQITGNKRELCFRAEPFDRDEVNPYTTNLGTIGLRKLGIRTIGVGKLRWTSPFTSRKRKMQEI